MMGINKAGECVCMKFFQYDNPRIFIRGWFDNTDFWNMTDKVFDVKGYKSIQSYDGFGFGGAGCEYQSSNSNNNFTFEHDGCGTLVLCPDDPSDDALLDELHLLANEIELIGSSNPEHQDLHVSKHSWPERQRITY
jgi:hypothetical protein